MQVDEVVLQMQLSGGQAFAANALDLRDLLSLGITTGWPNDCIPCQHAIS